MTPEVPRPNGTVVPGNLPARLADAATLAPVELGVPLEEIRGRGRRRQRMRLVAAASVVFLAVSGTAWGFSTLVERGSQTDVAAVFAAGPVQLWYEELPGPATVLHAEIPQRDGRTRHFSAHLDERRLDVQGDAFQGRVFVYRSDDEPRTYTVGGYAIPGTFAVALTLDGEAFVTPVTSWVEDSTVLVWYLPVDGPEPSVTELRALGPNGEVIARHDGHRWIRTVTPS
jgi:hypothetical protein